MSMLKVIEALVEFAEGFDAAARGSRTGRAMRAHYRICLHKAMNAKIDGVGSRRRQVKAIMNALLGNQTAAGPMQS